MSILIHNGEYQLKKEGAIRKEEDLLGAAS
jgi:hypothetical protein